MANREPVDDTLSSDELQSLQGMTATPSGDPTLRFVQQCQDWFEAWIDANKRAVETNAIPPSQVLMFIFAEAPDIERAKFSNVETQWKRFFPGSHDQNAQGVILGNENLRKSYIISPTLSSLHDAFQLAVDHLNASDTFAVAQLSQQRLLFHLPGGEIEDWCASPTASVLRLSTEPLSAARIEADVEEFHKESLQYAKNPIAQMIWVGKKEPYKLHPDPEQRIQSYLHLYLHASYKHLAGIVDEESVGKGGRCDIRVMWRSLPGAPFQPHTTTMLELKVLIEGDGPKHHRNWMLSGITQAHDYRRSDSEAVYACVFDARKDQSDQMLDLDQIAKEKDVRLRRYLMEAPIEKGAVVKSANSEKFKKGQPKKRLNESARRLAKKKDAAAK
jgi:hypothetical protein